MNVTIAGAGEVGGHAAEVLSADGHNVTVIDLSADRLRSLNETLDIRTLVGHCSHLGVLREAGIERSDLLIAATGIDEVNLLTASVAKVAGAKKTFVRVHHTAYFSLRSTKYAERLGVDDLADQPVRRANPRVPLRQGLDQLLIRRVLVPQAAHQPAATA